MSVDVTTKQQSKETVVRNIACITPSEAFVPIRVKVGYENNEKAFPVPEEEMISHFSGTVLNSLCTDKIQNDYYRLELQGKEVFIPVPPIGNMLQFDGYAVYDPYGNFQGTCIRLPPLHAAINSVLYHTARGLPPRIDVLSSGINRVLTHLIRETLITQRHPLGISGLFMSGDSFLKDGEIAITSILATEFIQKIITNFKKTAKSSSNPTVIKNYLIKASNLAKRLEDEGPGILNNWENVTVKREPAVAKGCLRQFTIVVVNTPGKAIYTTWRDIDQMGGDNDGDSGFIHCPEDPEGLSLYHHLLTSSPYVREKPLLFHTGSIITNKKGIRQIGLSSCSWTPESEEQVLSELQSKKLIGRAWYILWHYARLFAFPKDYSSCTSQDFKSLALKLEIIKSYAALHSNSQTAKSLTEVEVKLGSINWNFILFSDKEWHLWLHLSYVIMAESFFVLYELIFDMRKGDTVLPFQIDHLLDCLSGGPDEPSWDELAKQNIWIDPLKHVWTNLPLNGQKIRFMNGGLQYNPVFYSVMTKRRDWKGHSQAVVQFYNECPRKDFVEWMKEGLYLWINPEKDKLAKEINSLKM